MSDWNQGMTDVYNPKVHITAAELRAADIDVPEEILDCAWIP